MIQTHNYPDHDGIAAAYALQQLFAKFSHPSTICYGGLIHSVVLQHVIKELKIAITHINDARIDATTQLIMVDGAIENGNIATSLGAPVAIIDHHEASKAFEQRYPFSDVRANYGACSTIISEYFEESGIVLSPTVATALMMGIMMDTARFTRGVHQSDIRAFARLFPLGDWQTGSRLLRNSLTLSDSYLFKEAIANRIIKDGVCFITIHSDSSPEAIGLIADFFLGLREIHFVMVVCCWGEHYKCSVRSEESALPADKMLAEALRDIGQGGGHIYMAGGGISADRYPGDHEILRRLESAQRKLRNI